MSRFQIKDDLEIFNRTRKNSLTNSKRKRNRKKLKTSWFENEIQNLRKKDFSVKVEDIVEGPLGTKAKTKIEG